MLRLLVRAELAKICAQRVNRMAALVLLTVVLAFSYLAVTSFRFVDATGQAHSDLGAGPRLVADQEQWAGPLTPELIQRAVDQQRAERGRAGGKITEAIYGRVLQASEPLIYIVSAMMRGRDDDYDPHAILGADRDTVAHIYDRYAVTLTQTAKEEGQSSAKTAYLQAAYDRIPTPMAYGSTAIWETMIYYATMVMLVLVPGIGFVISRIFSDELQPDTQPVYCSTLHGPGLAVRAKILAGLFTATLLYGMGVGLLSAIGFGVLGTTGGGLPIQLDYQVAFYPFTFAQLYGVLIAFGYVAAILTTALVMAVSVVTRGNALAVALPFAVFLLSPFLARALPFKTLFTLTPDQLLNMLNNAKIPYIYQAGELVVPQFTLLPTIYVPIAAILIVTASVWFKANILG